MRTGQRLARIVSAFKRKYIVIHFSRVVVALAHFGFKSLKFRETIMCLEPVEVMVLGGMGCMASSQRVNVSNHHVSKKYRHFRDETVLL